MGPTLILVDDEPCKKSMGASSWCGEVMSKVTTETATSNEFDGLQALPYCRLCGSPFSGYPDTSGRRSRRRDNV